MGGLGAAAATSGGFVGYLDAGAAVDATVGGPITQDAATD
jgi:hypothetical protein